ncbi:MULTISPECIES: hypothetical protein [Bacillus amyloliquefaciens group]|uniref:hypothetical protein n=1 Tax=Bacillus amyloliquefaciens group TaxID=1938374 RepID=UPI00226D5B38|nr:hypothetical protein [Bacillus velezensis]MCY0092220.1 hypothetical protein [Bacillus velezensis]
MKKAFANVFMLLSLVVMVFAFSAPANAETKLTKEEKQNIDRLTQQMAKMNTVNDAKLLAEYKQKTENVLSSGKAKLAIDADKLVFDKMKLVKMEVSEGKFAYVIASPIKLKNSHELTNASFYYDEKGNFIATSEFHLLKNEKGNFQISNYQDAKLQIKENTDLKFETMADYKDKIKQSKWDTDHLAKCLGISAALAATIASVCGVVCLITVGLGCVACAAGVMGFNFGGTAECIRQSL